MEEAGKGEITLHYGHKEKNGPEGESCRSMRMERDEGEGDTWRRMGCEMGLRK